MKMKNFLKITIISIFILNQTIKTESNPIDTSLLQLVFYSMKIQNQIGISKQILKKK